jgi:uncharacterized protein
MTTSEQHINYEALAQDAIRGIVRTVLGRVAKTGALPGNHHFYISFDTKAPGVGLSSRLKERYPEEMTIVLQHRFSNLTVNERQFEVGLSFDGIPERLVVPFAAIKVFFDPSVPYGLQFEGGEAITDSMSELGGEAAEASGPRSARVRKGSARVDATGEATQKKPRAPRKPKAAKTGEVVAPERPRMGTTNQPDLPANDTKIIQLDKFRKKK